MNQQRIQPSSQAAPYSHSRPPRRTGSRRPGAAPFAPARTRIALACAGVLLGVFASAPYSRVTGEAAAPVSIDATPATAFAPKIQTVTVYPDRAMITRSAQVKLKRGRNTLRFTGGSVSLQAQSLRAYSDTNDCVVQGITSHLERTTASGNPAVRKLEAELQALENRQDAERKRAERARQDLNGIERYATFLAAFISENSTVANAGAKPGEQWQGALDFLDQRRGASRKSLQAAEETMQAIKDETGIVQARLNKIQSAGRRSSRTVEIVVQSLTGKAAQLSFSYVIKGASWNVSYGMYLEPDGRVTTEYYGNVYQETGEDWRNVRLQLSTATPSRGASRPSIAPVYVAAYETETREGFLQTERKAMPASADTDGAPGTSGGENTNTGGFAGVEANGESLVFQIPQKVDAPSSQRRQRVTIARFSEQPAQRFYRIVPALQQRAHLALRVPNKRGYPLLAGPVDAFRDSGYTGRSEIDYTPAGSPFLVGFGVDRSMSVERSLKRYRESTGTLSSGRYYHTIVTIEVRNRSDEKRKTTVSERVPVSDVEEVQVAVQNDTTGGYDRQDDSGILTWSFDLPPRTTKQIKLHYRVRVPDNYPGDLYGK
ncbi:MAG: mucoidy inhibitor MuiA family protein [bacterium]|nr:mucoidy inhibitor MuiA family protein [bacterium]